MGAGYYSIIIELLKQYDCTFYQTGKKEAMKFGIALLQIKNLQLL